MNRLMVMTENYVRGGGNRYLIDSVNAVRDRFGQVELVSNPGGIFEEDLAKLGQPAAIITVPFLTAARIYYALEHAPVLLRRIAMLMLKPLEPLLFLYNFMRSSRLIRRRSPSLVLVCNGGYPGGQAALATVLAARRHRVPVLLSVVSTPMRRRPLWQPYDRLVDSLVWNALDAVVVNARSIVAALHELRDMPMQKAVVVYNGLPAVPAAGQTLVKVTGEILIGCVARMDRAKGVLYLLDAFIRLAARHPQLKLVLVGDGDASAVLAQRVDAAGLRERVELMGHVKGAVDHILQSFDIYAFPSLHEGFPYSILEAMRSGCAIVSTDVGGIPEAVSDGREGLLVEAASVDGLEQAIERLILDQELRQRLGSEARAKFIRLFTLEAMSTQLSNVIGSLMRG